MKKILVILALFTSCSRYKPGNMYVSSIEGPYSDNMCNYSVTGSYSITDVVIQDTCGKFNIGDMLDIVKRNH